MHDGKIKVIIADDHPLIRLGVRKLFDGLQDIQIIGEAGNGQEAIELVEKNNPDILILDLHMPIMDGIKTLEHLKQCGSKVRILVVSAFDDQVYTSQIFTLGAWGYYLKEEAPALIVEAVRQAVKGNGQGTRPRPSPKLISKLSRAG